MSLLNARKLVFLVLVLLLVLVVAHQATFLASIYRVPSDDFTNVLPVIHQLQTADVFRKSPFLRSLAHVHLTTAPVYYYALAYPLSLFFHPSTAMKLLGLLFSGLLVYFSGAPWREYEDWIRAFFVTMVVLHLNFALNPLQGNRRSISLVAVMALIWLGDRFSFRRYLVVLLVTSGIYPPMGLLVLVWGLLSFVRNAPEKGWSTSGCHSLLGIFGFLFTVSPHLLTPSSTEEWVPAITYQFGSFPAVFRTFGVMGKGALFSYVSTFELFLILLLLVALEYLYTRGRMRVRPAITRIVAGGIIIWFAAHLTHPMLYQPFKYTRVWVLVLAVVFIDNFSLFVRSLKEHFPRPSWLRGVLVSLSLFTALLWWGKTAGLLEFGYRFRWNLGGGRLTALAFGLPLILSLAGLPGKNGGGYSHRLRTAGLVVLLCLFLFFPHCWVDCPIYFEAGKPPGYFQQLYTRLQSFPRPRLVAGPPDLMDLLPAFARSPVFFRVEQYNIRKICERMREFAPVYFEGDARRIHRYLRRRGIDLLLVDRRIFDGRQLVTCGADVKKNPPYALDRHFPKSVWSKDSTFYLLTPEQIL